jgi:hypothetical protein
MVNSGRGVSPWLEASRGLRQMGAFRRKRLVKFCTRRLRGGDAAGVPGVPSQFGESLSAACEYVVGCVCGGKLAAMERWPDIGTWLGTLCQSRPVFHSEADFQQALAWAIHTADPSARVRLETRPTLGMRLDVLIWRPDLNRYLALELKYLTAAWSGDVNGEQFGLVSQGAQDIRAYDVLKDVQRVEQFVDGHPGWSGMVLVLSNDPSYWSRPRHRRATNANAFRIYEDQVFTGARAWGPGTGAGTMKDREAVIELRGDYRCRWSPYSALPGSRGEFRLLALPVDASRPSPQVPGAVSRIPPSTADPSRAHAAAVSTAAADTGPPGTAAGGQRYSPAELRAELRRFEHQLRAAGLKETSVTTYVDRTSRFLKWLEGDYQPRGPN